MNFNRKQRILKSDTLAIRQHDYAERNYATFLPTLESHVAVPLAESIVSGLFLGVSVGTLVLLVCVIGGLGWFSGIKSGGLAFVLATFAWAWRCWHLQLSGYDALLWYQEFAKAPDERAEKRQTVDASVRVNNRWSFGHLPFDRANPGALVEFCRAVTNGTVTFSEAGASKNSYSVRHFRELRNFLVGSNLAYWNDEKNHQQGCTLLRGGRALVRNVAENPPSDDYEPDGDGWAMSPEIVYK